MSKRVILPGAVRAIRKARAASDPDFRGSVFATKCLISHAHLCNLEKGTKRASEEAIIRIAQALNVDIDDISYVIETEAVA